MTNKRKIRSIMLFGAGLLMGIALTAQVPNMLKLQRVRQHHPDYLPGALVKTDRPYDVAIAGRGYFCFSGPNKTTLYSRISNLTLDKTGNIVNKSGFLLQPAIQVPSDAIRIEISPDGMITAFDHLSQDNGIGQILLACFPNSEGLKPVDVAFFGETEKCGLPTFSMPGDGGVGFLLQGYQLLSSIPPNTPSHLIINGPYYNGPNDEQQEPLIETGRLWDFGVEGPGFAAVTLGDGRTAYTRYLDYSLSDYGEVVKKFPMVMGLQAGIPLEPSVKKDDFRMESIPLYRFSSPENLHYYMKGIYLETDRSGQPKKCEQGKDGTGIIKRGFLNQVSCHEP
ncbi:MAG: hypothetical protein AB1656_04075 [Candidatus Omnitrophota bacterium]